MATTLPKPGAENVLYIVDLSGYIFRAYHAIQTPLTSPSGEPTHATMGTITMLQRLVSARKPSALAIAMDSPGPTFRKELDPNYKANRPPAPEDLKVQIRRCVEYVAATGWATYSEKGLEADDLIAALVDKARAERLKVVIVSADKDLMQLVDPQTCLWDSMRNRVYGLEEVEKKFGVPPSQVRDLLALMGDTSDNVPGVPGVGPKTAAKLLTAHGDIDGIYQNIDSVRGKKLVENLRNHEDSARLSQVLVTLKRDIEIEFDKQKLTPGDGDVEKLRTLYRELGFKRFLAQLGGDGAEEEQSAEPSVDASERDYRLICMAHHLEDFVQAAKQSEWLAIDTETTSKNPMEAELVGISLACERGKAVYVPIAHKETGGYPQLSLEQITQQLQPILAAKSPKKTGHHLKYDELVLRRHGIRLEGIGCDTMIASYLLDPAASHGLKALAERELGQTMTTFEQALASATPAADKDAKPKRRKKGPKPTFADVPLKAALGYAAADADFSLELALRLLPRLEAEGMGKLLTDVELPLSSVLVDLELEGIELDTAHLAELETQMADQIDELEAKAHELAGKEFNVNSPRQLEGILFDDLELRVIKRTKTARSTDAQVLEALANEHELPKTILRHRQLAKLLSTYVRSLPKLVSKDRSRVHGRFNQTVAATGRLSSSDPNLQNIPIRGEEGRAIREAFRAKSGHVLLSADYSQIELRVLAHLAEDPVLLDAFQTAQDIHTRTAMEIFQVDADGVDGDQRRAAKTINFGVIYGMGDSALARRLNIPKKQAASFIEAYFERYRGVKAYMRDVLLEARQAGSVSTLLGRRRFLPELESGNRAVRLAAERVAQNTPIQGSAADILKLAMLRLKTPVVEGARMLLTVHDELVFEVPEAHAEAASEAIRFEMENVVALKVPLVVEVGSGPTWAEAH